MATLLYKEAKTSVESLSANLFEVVLLEISDTSEKFDIGSRLQVPFVSFRPIGNRCALLVKNEYGKIKSGSKCGVAGFIYEDRQLPHETPFKIKMSGGNPPPTLGGPSIRGNHLIYTMPSTLAQDMATTNRISQLVTVAPGAHFASCSLFAGEKKQLSFYIRKIVANQQR